MTEVRLKDEDSLERALKLFKRKLQKSGLFGELRRRRHYVKPSEARAIKNAVRVGKQLVNSGVNEKIVERIERSNPGD